MEGLAEGGVAETPRDTNGAPAPVITSSSTPSRGAARSSAAIRASQRPGPLIPKALAIQAPQRPWSAARFPHDTARWRLKDGRLRHVPHVADGKALARFPPSAISAQSPRRASRAELIALHRTQFGPPRSATSHSPRPPLGKGNQSLDQNWDVDRLIKRTAHRRHLHACGRHQTSPMRMVARLRVNAPRTSSSSWTADTKRRRDGRLQQRFFRRLQRFCGVTPGVPEAAERFLKPLQSGGGGGSSSAGSRRRCVAQRSVSSVPSSSIARCSGPPFVPVSASLRGNARLHQHRSTAARTQRLHGRLLLDTSPNVPRRLV